MIISYNEFCELLLKHIQFGEDFYLNLLETIIKNPTRYCGLFRISNAKTKLIQNITQSNEIKYGDFIEELTTEYISRLGYKNFDKDLGKNDNGDALNIDQYFTDGNKIYIVEMKMRDDHDSTKKRGQYENFQKKIKLIAKNNPDKMIDASMWFVDDGLIKNKNFYEEMMEKDHYPNCILHLYYGKDFFNSLDNGKKAWDEFIDILTEYRLQNSQETVDIPDFGTSSEIYDALLKLPDNYWKKLNSSSEKYELLREELFASGDNLKKAKDNREN